MRLGTTIAAVLLVGSLTSSTTALTTPDSSPSPTAPPSIGPPDATVASAVTMATARSVPSRPSAAPATRDAASWMANLAAGEGAGVRLVAGTARLDPAGVFLAPLEQGDERGAAATGSTGADPARASTEGVPDGAADVPVPTGLLTLPIQRLGSATRRVDSVVIGVVPTGSTATVDIRGRDADGNWSEWIPTGGEAGTSVVLPRPAVAVQGRLVLTGPPAELAGSLDGPAVQGVTLTAHPTVQPSSVAPSEPPSDDTPQPTPSSPATAGDDDSAIAGDDDTAAAGDDDTATPTTAPTPGPTTTTEPTTASDRTDATTTTVPTTTTPPAAAAQATPTSESTKSTSSNPKTSTKSSAKTTTKTTTTTKTPSATTSPKASATGALKYRVFATREGLVGRSTANGHKIKSSDRFVALPSRRALSPRGTGDYSVRVCASNGRCAVAPVWDVGPWNTRDDYWNPPSRRQEWRDLPQGMPEAQAAKERGYNGGRDQFKRKVLNPAGIDLSDGLFWGALGLKDNSWVTVEYLWTGTGKSGTDKSGTDEEGAAAG